VLVGVLVPTALVEGTLRDDVAWRPIALVLAVGLAFTLLWRRTKPLAAVAVTFGALVVVDTAALIADAGPWGYTRLPSYFYCPIRCFGGAVAGRP